MDLFIHKDYLQLPWHLKLTNDVAIRFEADIPPNSLVCGTPQFEDFCKLYLLEPPEFPPRNYVKAYQGLQREWMDSTPPWPLCIPQKAYRKSVKELAMYLNNCISKLDTTYYEKTFVPSNSILSSLRPAKINVAEYERIVASDASSVVSSFKPDSAGYTAPVSYARTTTTGRISVTSGPCILQLRKDYRSVFSCSRFGTDGVICSADFVALEPRVALAVYKPAEDVPEDIYEYVRLKLFGASDNITRDVVKRVVLEELYGAGYDTIAQKLPDIKNLSELIKAINQFFGIDAMRAKLVAANEANQRQHITNFYGRMIDTTQAKPYMLVNYFTQSTAVDVALQGFSGAASTIAKSGKQDRVVPLFVIHDDLVLDVHKEELPFLEHLCRDVATRIPGFPNTIFHLKLKQLF